MKQSKKKNGERISQSVIETKSHTSMRIKRQDFVSTLAATISHAQKPNICQKRQKKRRKYTQHRMLIATDNSRNIVCVEVNIPCDEKKFISIILCIHFDVFAKDKQHTLNNLSRIKWY